MGQWSLTFRSIRVADVCANLVGDSTSSVKPSSVIVESQRERQTETDRQTDRQTECQRNSSLQAESKAIVFLYLLTVFLTLQDFT